MQIIKRLALLVVIGLICAGVVKAADVYQPDRGMDGFWVLEKTGVHGVEPDDPELAGFYKRFDGMAFEVFNGMVYFNTGCVSYHEPIDTTCGELFAKALWDTDAAAFKERFDKNFGVALNDPLTVWRLPFCETMQLDLLILPERLFLVDEGLFYGAYRKTGLREYLDVAGLDLPGCREYPIEMGLVIQDVEPGTTLARAYGQMLVKYPDVAKHLRLELPRQNEEYQSDVDAENVYVSYVYTGTNALAVELIYGGGVTTLEMIVDEEIALTRIMYSAD